MFHHVNIRTQQRIQHGLVRTVLLYRSNRTYLTSDEDRSTVRYTTCRSTSDMFHWCYDWTVMGVTVFWCTTLVMLKTRCVCELWYSAITSRTIGRSLTGEWTDGDWGMDQEVLGRSEETLQWTCCLIMDTCEGHEVDFTLPSAYGISAFSHNYQASTSRSQPHSACENTLSITCTREKSAYYATSTCDRSIIP